MLPGFFYYPGSALEVYNPCSTRVWVHYISGSSVQPYCVNPGGGALCLPVYARRGIELLATAGGSYGPTDATRDRSTRRPSPGMTGWPTFGLHASSQEEPWPSRFPESLPNTGPPGTGCLTRRSSCAVPWRRWLMPGGGCRPAG